MDADGSKKLRKPYTITKSRDRWSDEEHERFLDALLLFGREWKKIEDFIGTKTVIQIRSHAQKYFLKVQKNGVMAHVPPARPKRNSTRPYPKKPSDDDPTPLQLQSSMICPSTSTGLIVSSSSWDDPSFLRDFTSNDALSSSNYYNALCGVECDNRPLGLTNIYNHNIGWTGSSSTSQLTAEAPKQAIPEFAKVYRFIGTLIDPDINCTMGMYLQKLKEMDPITAKTISWLSTYDPETKTIGSAMEASGFTNVMYPPYQVPGEARYLPQP
uniref:Protein REVEILLE 8-like isoform X2 n=1 Tax=Cymbidium ensifolium TaxID=78740 RepID=A0A515HGC7_CYMEN|nr:protein REVEILLE 8-like isoform X2 [Cymbidium ensifolium]